MPNAQQAVWRQSGCMLAESLVGIWKFIARPNFSVPPPARQAATTLCASRATERFKQRLFRKVLDWLSAWISLNSGIENLKAKWKSQHLSRRTITRRLFRKENIDLTIIQRTVTFGEFENYKKIRGFYRVESRLETKVRICAFWI